MKPLRALFGGAGECGALFSDGSVPPATGVSRRDPVSNPTAALWTLSQTSSYLGYRQPRGVSWSAVSWPPPRSCSTLNPCSCRLLSFMAVRVCSPSPHPFVNPRTEPTHTVASTALPQLRCPIDFVKYSSYIKWVICSNPLRSTAVGYICSSTDTSTLLYYQIVHYRDVDEIVRVFGALACHLGG